jgi:hypothetical protein
MVRRAHSPSDYLLPPEIRKFKRDVTVYLEDPMFDSVFKYALETAPDRPVQDAIRDLLLQAIAADAANGAIRVARMMAFRETRARTLTACAGFMRHLAEELQAEAAGATETATPQLENRIEIPASAEDAA